MLDVIFILVSHIAYLHRIGQNGQKANQFPPKDANMIKLIITDLDGTFLNNQGD